jgi:putative ABC transport system permease protein
MAFGARAWHITVEYLLEAIFIGLVGGLTGFALGVGLAQLLDVAGRAVGMDVFLITDRLAKVALLLATALGVLAGTVPALRAAKIDPDLAIRAQ